MAWIDGQLDYTDLSANAGLLGTQIADGTIQTRNLAPQAVLNTQIVNNTITNQQIATDTITATNIASLNFTGKSAIFDTGTVGGFNLGTNYIEDSADSFGLASLVTAGDDVRFWAGSTYANRATAPFNVTKGGVITATSGTVGGWNLSPTALVGPTSAVIRSGQTDFNVGTGFWLGNPAGTPKFSIGTQGGNRMYWDGTNLVFSGAFTASTVMSTFSYTVANLPLPATTVGFNSPSANA